MMCYTNNMSCTKEEWIVLIIMLVGIIGIAILLGFLLRNKSEKIRRLPLLVVTIILIVLEVIKQVRSIVKGYDMWTFPLHFCSTYFIWFSFANFTKGKFQKAMQCVAFVASLYLVVLFYFDPVSIIGHSSTAVFESFSNFHTFVFHHLVLLYFFLVIALKTVDFKFEYCIYFSVSMVIYYCIAVLFANLFNVNYMNILHSNIDFMESFRVSCGQVLYNIVLGVLTVFAGTLIILILSLIRKKKFAKK